MCGDAGKTEIPCEHVHYLSASGVMIHEQVLYQVYVALPLPHIIIIKCHTHG